MSFHVNDIGPVFEWLNQQSVPYVILRGIEPEEDDLDLLVDDRGLPDFFDMVSQLDKRRGTKLDVYGVRGLYGTSYHGFTHIPEDLGERALLRRQARPDGRYTPNPEDYFLSLAYHVIYHKSLQSRLPLSDGEAIPTDSKAGRTLRQAADAWGGTNGDLSQGALHNILVGQGFGVSQERLEAYIRHDFRFGRKAPFHARLMNLLPGEMNLYVIRAVADRERQTKALLARLQARFEVVASKRIHWITRWLSAKKMRGGKWRRGGRPVLAAVVYDPSPIPASTEDLTVHPDVLNRNQFIKQEWRTWFTQTTGAKGSDNPIHSTDNEAEAVGHLPLFFDSDERREIAEAIHSLRGPAEISDYAGR